MRISDELLPNLQSFPTHCQHYSPACRHAAVSVCVDSFFWQRLLWPEGEGLWFNVYMNKSHQVTPTVTHYASVIGAGRSWWFALGNVHMLLVRMFAESAHSLPRAVGHTALLLVLHFRAAEDAAQLPRAAPVRGAVHAGHRGQLRPLCQGGRLRCNHDKCAPSSPDSDSCVHSSSATTCFAAKNQLIMSPRTKKIPHGWIGRPCNFWSHLWCLCRFILFSHTRSVQPASGYHHAILTLATSCARPRSSVS